MRALKVNHFKRLVFLLAIKLRGVISYSLYLPLLPLLPVILQQGKSVKANTIRLAEASGPRHFRSTHTYSPSLLHIGESTVAGVGVDDFQQGLTACVAKQFECSWQALGSNGAAIADINQLLVSTDFKPADLVLVTMGVNDTTSLTRRKTWLAELMTCIEHVSARAHSSKSNLGAQAQVCFTQVPPMHLFPALPFPLNCFLGLRAWQLDLSLRQICLRKGWHHLAIDIPLKQQWMAVDGYHPNAEGYQAWAQEIAPLLIQTLDKKDFQDQELA